MNEIRNCHVSFIQIQFIPSTSFIILIPCSEHTNFNNKSAYKKINLSDFTAKKDFEDRI